MKIMRYTFTILGTLIAVALVLFLVGQSGKKEQALPRQPEPAAAQTPVQTEQIPVDRDNLFILKDGIHVDSFFEIFQDGYEGDVLELPVVLERETKQGYCIVLTGDAFSKKAKEVILNLRKGEKYICIMPDAYKHPRFGPELRYKRPYPVSWGDPHPADGTRRIVIDDPAYIKTAASTKFPVEGEPKQRVAETEGGKINFPPWYTQTK